MNIFITGGTGFIGRHLLKRLGKTSHNIFCLKRKDTINDHPILVSIFHRSPINRQIPSVSDKPPPSVCNPSQAETGCNFNRI